MTPGTPEGKTLIDPRAVVALRSIDATRLAEMPARRRKALAAADPDTAEGVAVLLRVAAEMTELVAADVLERLADDAKTCRRMALLSSYLRGRRPAKYLGAQLVVPEADGQPTVGRFDAAELPGCVALTVAVLRLWHVVELAEREGGTGR